MNKKMLNYAKITVQFMAQRGQPREYCFYVCNVCNKIFPPKRLFSLVLSRSKKTHLRKEKRLVQ